MGCKFTKNELTEFANQYALKYWAKELDIPIELVNRQWTRRAAVYCIYRDGRKVIRMSKQTNLLLTNEQVLGNLLHELCHHFCYIEGKEFRDDSEYFVTECIRVGAPVSKTKKAQKAFGKYAKKHLS